MLLLWWKYFKHSSSCYKIHARLLMARAINWFQKPPERARLSAGELPALRPYEWDTWCVLSSPLPPISCKLFDISVCLGYGTANVKECAGLVYSAVLFWHASDVCVCVCVCVWRGILGCVLQTARSSCGMLACDGCNSIGNCFTHNFKFFSTYVQYYIRIYQIFLPWLLESIIILT